ncbi:hypothetical protein SPONN_2618 [uncultured Candidatus Thioglobus sp.]|nr:hypothetical protein SPONN_2618 [uncultured Candidatus Thioglobus sp.]SMN01921.1 hypothetical protein SPONL_200 [uncultured Candidatus Thioglobus sp.]
MHEDFNSDGLKLLSGGMIYVAYVWTWLSVDSGDDGDGDENQPSDDDPDSDDGVVTHTITFKCIGANKDINYQTALQRASDIMNNGSMEAVPVRLTKEPNNPKDSMAVAFECLLEDEWKTIGYVVKEVVVEVNEAIRDHLVLSVKFAWIKFLICWTKSGPGFYAGINISKRGTWSRTVKRFASTK